jgi:hypothetical protein
VNGTHEIDAAGSLVSGSIKFDFGRSVQLDVADYPEELKDFGLDSIGSRVFWGDILSEADLLPTYEIDRGTRGHSAIPMKIYVYISEDVRERYAEAAALKMRMDKKNDYYWKETLKRIMDVKKFRMQEPVMVMLPADFERISATDSFSLFPVGSKWFKLKKGRFRELKLVSSDDSPRLSLSEKWAACLLKTVDHHDIPPSLAAGPLFICILADVVPFVEDSSCPVPDVVPVFSVFTMHRNKAVSWETCASLDIENPEEFSVIWTKDERIPPDFFPEEEKSQVDQLVKYARQGPFGKAHVKAMLDAHGYFKGTARFE